MGKKKVHKKKKVYVGRRSLGERSQRTLQKDGTVRIIIRGVTPEYAEVFDALVRELWADNHRLTMGPIFHGLVLGCREFLTFRARKACVAWAHDPDRYDRTLGERARMLLEALFGQPTSL